jgi:hypothetical protein
MIFFIAIESFTGNHEEKIGLPHRSATMVGGRTQRIHDTAGQPSVMDIDGITHRIQLIAKNQSPITDSNCGR